MIIRCNLNESDYRAYQWHVMFRYRKVHWLYGILLGLLLWLTWTGGSPEATAIDKLYTLIGVVLYFGGASLAFYVIVRLILRLRGASFQGTTGEHLFDISDDGLIETSQNSKIETRRVGIKRLDETEKHFFVITSNGMGHVIPKRGLNNLEAVRSLQAKVMKVAK